MAYGFFNLDEHNANNSGIRATIAVNSLSVKQGSPLKSTSAWVDVAGAGDTIVGISVTKKDFDSDNFTVAMEKVEYNPEPNLNNLYELPINGGTVTIADEGVSYYDIMVNAGEFAVDGSTESASTGQLLLVRYISATRGIFRVVNA